MNKVSENPFKNRISSNSVLVCCVVLFSTLYIVSNIMAVKVISLFGYFYFDAGTITFPMAYMLGDVITELWGYKTAKKVIYVTLLSNIVMVLCTQIGVWLPAPDYMADTAAAYSHVFMCPASSWARWSASCLVSYPMRGLWSVSDARCRAGGFGYAP